MDPLQPWRKLSPTKLFVRKQYFGKPYILELLFYRHSSDPTFCVRKNVVDVISKFFISTEERVRSRKHSHFVYWSEEKSKAQLQN